MSHRRTGAVVSTLLLTLALVAGWPVAAGASEGTAVAAAREALHRGDPAAAIGLLEARRASGEATFEELALLGGLHLDAGRPAVALGVLAPAAARADAGPAVLYHAGLAALALGDEAAGESYLERAAALAPASPAARLLGLRRGAAADYAAADRLLGPWLARHPDDREATVAALAAALELGRLEAVGAALAALPAGEDAAPAGDPRLALLRARHRDLSRQPAGVVAALEPWRDLVPEVMRPDLLRLLGSAYLDVGRAGDAVTLLAGSVGDDPRRALLLAEARSRQGDLDGAVAELAPFVAAALARPSPTGSGDVELLYDAGRYLLAAGDATRAAEVLAAASLRGPDEKLVWAALGRALALLGRTAEATAAMDRYRRIAAEQAAAAHAAGGAAPSLLLGAGDDAARESSRPADDPPP